MEEEEKIDEEAVNRVPLLRRISLNPESANEIRENMDRFIDRKPIV